MMYFNKRTGETSHTMLNHTMVAMGDEWPVYAGGRYCGYVSHGKFVPIKAPQGKLLFDVDMQVVGFRTGVAIGPDFWPVYWCGIYIGYFDGGIMNV